mmetsp:Transcript_19091/g.60010  ORF Transcript_19091/g.60010 Transcript_19091/m.60010 type:complete len:522 (+) Transcript_19091:301-1866(+)
MGRKEAASDGRSAPRHRFGRSRRSSRRCRWGHPSRAAGGHWAGRGARGEEGEELADDAFLEAGGGLGREGLLGGAVVDEEGDGRGAVLRGLDDGEVALDVGEDGGGAGDASRGAAGVGGEGFDEGDGEGAGSDEGDAHGEVGGAEGVGEVAAGRGLVGAEEGPDAGEEVGAAQGFDEVEEHAVEEVVLGGGADAGDEALVGGENLAVAGGDGHGDAALEEDEAIVDLLRDLFVVEDGRVGAGGDGDDARDDLALLRLEHRIARLELLNVLRGPGEDGRLARLERGRAGLVEDVGELVDLRHHLDGAGAPVARLVPVPRRAGRRAPLLLVLRRLLRGVLRRLGRLPPPRPPAPRAARRPRSLGRRLARRLALRRRFLAPTVRDRREPALVVPVLRQRLAQLRHRPLLLPFVLRRRAPRLGVRRPSRVLARRRLRRRRLRPRARRRSRRRIQLHRALLLSPTAAALHRVLPGGGRRRREVAHRLAAPGLRLGPTHRPGGLPLRTGTPPALPARLLRPRYHHSG